MRFHFLLVFQPSKVAWWLTNQRLRRTAPALLILNMLVILLVELYFNFVGICNVKMLSHSRCMDIHAWTLLGSWNGWQHATQKYLPLFLIYFLKKRVPFCGNMEVSLIVTNVLWSQVEMSCLRKCHTHMMTYFSDESLFLQPPSNVIL